MSCWTCWRPMSHEHNDADAAYKAAHHQQSIRAAFYWYTGEAPSCGPGDLGKAKEYLQRLVEARNRCAPLTPSEHTRLTKLIQKWTLRAAGKDIRFMVMGTSRGAPTAQQKHRMQQLGWHSTHVPTWKEPLKKKPCQHCRKFFLPTRVDKKFCTDWCRSKYWQAIYKGEQ